jgi:hypothetical protein
MALLAAALPIALQFARLWGVFDLGSLAALRFKDSSA